MKQNVYYTIYRTTNLINGKFYIGKHKTNIINDNYFGSGIAVTQAIKKYGKENFIKEILFVFNNELDMNNKEKELVNEILISNFLCYNNGLGGEGGPLFKNKKHSSETKKKISIALQGKKRSIEVRVKISESNRKRVVTENFRQRMKQVAIETWKKRKASG